MSTQLQSYTETFQQAESELLQLSRPLTDNQFNWKPDETSWSIGECIAHLNRVAEAFLPPLEAAARRTEPTAQGPFTYGFIVRKMIDAMGPGGPALSASRALDPSESGASSMLEKAQTLAAPRGTSLYVRRLTGWAWRKSRSDTPSSGCCASRSARSCR